MAYVPPAARKKQLQEAAQKLEVGADTNGGGEGPAPAATPTAAEPERRKHPYPHDINHYFWPNRKDTDEDQLRDQWQSKKKVHQGTLNASADAPDQLKYVMLFKDANPRWNSDGIIFVKSSLHLLPGAEKFEPNVEDKEQQNLDDENNNSNGAAPSAGDNEQPISSAADGTTDSATATTEQEGTDNSMFTPDLSLYDCGPIAVFEQLSEKGGKKGGFQFLGYHKITRLQFLAPCSDQLHRMLLQKFYAVDARDRIVKQKRSRQAWAESMSYRWAVMKLEKDEETETPAPKIEFSVRKPPGRKPREPKKTVNELLKEMRLQDEALAATGEDGGVGGAPKDEPSDEAATGEDGGLVVEGTPEEKKTN